MSESKPNVPILFRPEGPEPLVREKSKSEPYPVDALGKLRGVVEEVHAKTQAPHAIAAASALSAASFAVQAHADVETLVNPVPLSLYFLTIAHSGERKSTCDKLVMQGVRSFEHDLAAAYAEQFPRHQIALKAHNAKVERLSKDAASRNSLKATEAQADLEALGAAPLPPLLPQIIAADPTIEGLYKLFEAGRPSLGVFTDEGGGFIGGHSMSKDHKLKTVAGLSVLWGGETLNRVRSGDGASALRGRRLALHLMVQPVVADPLLFDPVAIGQGFLARCLISAPPSAIGTRLADWEDTGNADIKAMALRLSETLCADVPLRDGTRQELQPRILPLSVEAKKLLKEFYRTTEAEQATGGSLEHVRSFASKAPEQAARIAGVLTLWPDLNAREVTGETMASAIEIASYYLSEAQRLVGGPFIPEPIAKAEQLRAWLHETWPSIANKQGRDPKIILPRDVVTYGPSSMRTSKAAKAALGMLLEHNYVVRLPSGEIVAGSTPREAYRMVEVAV